MVRKNNEDFTAQEAKEEFSEAQEKLAKRLKKPIFKKGGVRTRLGKQTKGRANLKQANDALRRLL